MRHDSWRDALFLHFEVDAAALGASLPEHLVPDLFEGKAYASVVALSEVGIAPALPAWVPGGVARALKLSHDAVNARAYVRPAAGGGAPGIFFFSLDCSGALPALGARALFNLPYRLARMRRSPTTFESAPAVGGGGPFYVEWAAGLQAPAPAPPGSRAAFLVERYRLYNEAGLALRPAMPRFGPGLWVGRITHAPWPLVDARVTALTGAAALLEAHGLRPLSPDPAAAHFSPGVADIAFFWAPLPAPGSSGTRS